MAKEVHYELRMGRLWQIQKVPGPLLYALQARGLDFATVAWVILRRYIVFGGGEARYNSYRKELESILERG